MTTFCLIRCQDDLLVLAKNDSEFEPSLTFPGGHVEANESVTAGAVREAHEETGLTVTDPKLCGFVNFARKDGRKELIFIYAFSVADGEVTATLAGTKNGGATKWLPITTVQKAKLNAVVQAVLDTYLNGSTRELYFA